MNARRGCRYFAVVGDDDSSRTAVAAAGAVSVVVFQGEGRVIVERGSQTIRLTRGEFIALASTADQIVRQWQS